MKRYTDMTDEELLALNHEQIQTLVDLELAFDGVKMVPSPEDVEKKKPNIKANITGYKCRDFVFQNKQDALAFSKMDLYTSYYGYYDADYDLKWLHPLNNVPAEVTEVQLLTKEEVMANYDELLAWKNHRCLRDKMKKEYDSYQRARNEVQSKVNKAIYDAQEAKYQIQLAEQAYAHYLDLTNGDMDTARRFFYDAYKDKEAGFLAVAGLQLCGHPLTSFISSEEGTCYCQDCSRNQPNT